VPNSRPNRLLAVRLSSLGDLVHTLPVVPALRSAFPDAQLDWVVDSRWSPLIKLVRGIDEVIALRSSVSGYFECMSRVRQAGYSCAIDFQGIYRSAVLGWASGAKRRIGRDRNSAREHGAARFYTDRVPPLGQHVAEMSMSLALRAGAQRPSQMEFPIQVPTQEAGRLREKLRSEGAENYFVVSPGGGAGNRSAGPRSALGPCVLRCGNAIGYAPSSISRQAKSSLEKPSSRIHFPRDPSSIARP